MTTPNKPQDEKCEELAPCALQFMVVPELLKTMAYVPEPVRLKIVDPEAIFLTGLLGESGRKLVEAGVEFYFTRPLAQKLIEKGIAVETQGTHPSPSPVVGKVELKQGEEQCEGVYGPPPEKDMKMAGPLIIPHGDDGCNYVPKEIPAHPKQGERDAASVGGSDPSFDAWWKARATDIYYESPTAIEPEGARKIYAELTALKLECQRLQANLSRLIEIAKANGAGSLVIEAAMATINKEPK